MIVLYRSKCIRDVFVLFWKNNKPIFAGGGICPWQINIEGD